MKNNRNRWNLLEITLEFPEWLLCDTLSRVHTLCTVYSSIDDLFYSPSGQEIVVTDGRMKLIFFKNWFDTHPESYYYSIWICSARYPWLSRSTSAYLGPYDIVLATMYLQACNTRCIHAESINSKLDEEVDVIYMWGKINHTHVLGAYFVNFSSLLIRLRYTVSAPFHLSSFLD